MKTRKLSALLLTLLLLISSLLSPLSSLTPTALADGEDEEPKPIISENISANDYTNWNRWAENVRSYMFDSGSGAFTRVEYTGEDGVFVELFKDNKFQWRKEITMELPLWGGFYAGEQYNFFVFGQDNLNENDNREVVRIVRYTKDWQRVDAVSVRGANTTIPFEAGSLRIAESGDTLYIHSCHLMYGYGGTRHQATMWFDVKAPKNGSMEMLRSGWEVSNSTKDYVSHSFNQFVVTDGDYVVKVDHGDAYPRSVTLCRKPLDGRYVSRVTVLPIVGEFGDNDTGVALGGFEATDSSYILAGNAVTMDDNYDPFGVRNIFISVINKDTLTVSGAYLTNYGPGEKTVSNPRLVKISGNKLLLMWNEGVGKEYNTLKYLIIDGAGQIKSALYSVEAYLSDCQPIVMNNKVTWYVTDAETMKLYSIDVSTMELSIETLAEGGVKPIEDDPNIMKVEEDTEVTLSISVVADAPQYQWQYSKDEGDTWEDFPEYEQNGNTTKPTGSGTNTLVFTGTAQYNNNLFRCRIIIGTRTLYSTPLRIVVILKNQPEPEPEPDPHPEPDPLPDEPIPGDLNGDGQVDNVDLVTLARATVGIVILTEAQKTAADMNVDGNIDNQDLVMLARQLVTK